MRTALSDIQHTYDIVIGIECHVQLATKTKLFSGADNDARDAAPNTKVNPVDFGLPGVLPVLNESAVELAIKAGIALDATIPRLSRFERKHYFYPDLPFGYQITQLAEPVIVGGSVEIATDDGIKTIRLHHAHLEADAGKLTHPAGCDYSLVDLNRAGTPLIEVVSEADISSPAEAKAYAQTLYQLMTFAGVTHGDLYHGNMRFDVNLSLKPKGTAELGTRTETKNLNSFRSVERAAAFEAIRQAQLLDKGERITQETRGWNEDKQKTFSQRSKENAHDYRYFPDGDLPPVIIEPSRVDEVRRHMPLMPRAYREAWGSLNIDETVIAALLNSPNFRAPTVYRLQQEYGDAVARRVAHWFGSVIGDDESPISHEDVKLEYLAELAEMAEKSEVKSSDARLLFAEMLVTNRSPRELAGERSMLQSNDESEISRIVDEILADPSSEKVLSGIRSGNEKAIGYLVGQAMKKTQGKANPAMLQKILRSKL